MSLNFKNADTQTKRDILIAIADCAAVAFKHKGAIFGNFVQNVIVPLLTSENPCLRDSIDKGNLDDLDFYSVSFEFLTSSDLNSFLLEMGQQMDIFLKADGVNHCHFIKFGVQVAYIRCSTFTTALYDVNRLGYQGGWLCKMKPNGFATGATSIILINKIREKKATMTNYGILQTWKSLGTPEFEKYLENMRYHFFYTNWTIIIGDESLCDENKIIVAVKKAYKQIRQNKLNKIKELNVSSQEADDCRFRLLQKANDNKAYFAPIHCGLSGPLLYKLYFSDNETINSFKTAMGSELDEYGVLGDNYALVICKIHDVIKYNFDIDCLHPQYTNDGLSFSIERTEDNKDLYDKMDKDQLTILPRYRKKLLTKDSTVKKFNANFRNRTVEYNGNLIKLPVNKEKLRDFLNGKVDKSTDSKEIIESVGKLLTDLTKLKEMLEKLN